MHLSIVIPVYNEEQRLRRCLDLWTTYLWNYTNYQFEILPVLNGCTDGSDEIARDFAELWPHIRILRLPDKGKGLAVRNGMLAANGKYCYMADVDLATPPNLVPAFLEQARHFDIVAGWRPPSPDPLRQALHSGFQAFTSGMTGVHDSQCGFKMFRLEVARAVFGRAKVDGWAFDVEALWIARSLGLSIQEISIPWDHDPASKVNPARDAVLMFADVMRIKRLHPEIAA